MATNAASVEIVTKERKRPPFLIEVFTRLVKEKPLGTVGGAIVLILFLVGIFANFLAPFGYNDIFLAHRLEAPSSAFWLGTDNLGRDLMSRIIYGARISMIVGLCVPTITMCLSLMVGGLSGYFGGKYDLVVQRFVDTIQCFPPLVIMLTVVAVTGPGLLQVILILGVMGGIGGGTRVNRSAVIGVKGNVYIEAARAIGATNSRIFLRHILPNIMAVVIVSFSMGMGGAILAEASLSFLGFGIPPPTPSWGGMLSGSGRKFMLQAPWMVLWPGVALSLAVYGMNMLGDGLRDVLDPRLRGGLGRYGRTVKKAKS
jgi:peptide/nickel transport system permease protein